MAAFLTSPKLPSPTWGGTINLGRGIVPPQTPPQWVRGIYRPNIQDTVITVIGLYGIGLGLLLYVASSRFGG